LIPAPGVSLSYFPSSSVFILFTVPCSSEIEAEFTPTTPNVVLNTLSRVVIPREDNPTILVVFTTTASERVIGTNS
jgi:hypothetical protein